LIQITDIDSFPIVQADVGNYFGYQFHKCVNVHLESNYVGLNARWRWIGIIVRRNMQVFRASSLLLNEIIFIVFLCLSKVESILVKVNLAKLELIIGYCNLSD
jgi:hypothetical protein